MMSYDDVYISLSRVVRNTTKNILDMKISHFFQNHMFVFIPISKFHLSIFFSNQNVYIIRRYVYTYGDTHI